MSDSLRPRGLQHARLPCPSPTPRACSNSCPLSQWYHPTLSTSVIPFSSCLQSCPASGSLPIGQFFTSSGQSIGVSALVSVLPVNIQDWFPLGLIGLISLQSKGLSRVENQHRSSKTSVRWHSAFLIEALTREDILKCFPQYMWFVTREVTNLGFFSMAPSKQHEQQKTVIFSLNLWREYPVLEFWLIYTPYLGPSTGKVWENLFCKY